MALSDLLAGLEAEAAAEKAELEEETSAEVTRIGESLSEWRAIMPPPAKEEPEADDDGTGG